jgi:hypothetical protein
VVQRAQQVALDQLAEEVVGGEQHVEVDLAGAELGDRLVHVAVGGDLHLDVVAGVLLLEVLDDLLVDVLGPVVDLEGRAPLGRQTRGDRLVARLDRPGDRVVGAGQQRALGAGRRAGHVALAAPWSRAPPETASAVAAERARKALRLIGAIAASLACTWPNARMN